MILDTIDKNLNDFTNQFNEMHKITMVTFSSLFLLLIIAYNNYFLSANASTSSSESRDIIQIPSESTDFPGNNQNALEILFAKATVSSNDAVHVVDQ